MWEIWVLNLMVRACVRRETVFVHLLRRIATGKQKKDQQAFRENDTEIVNKPAAPDQL